MKVSTSHSRLEKNVKLSREEESELRNSVRIRQAFEDLRPYLYYNSLEKERRIFQALEDFAMDMITERNNQVQIAIDRVFKQD